MIKEVFDNCTLYCADCRDVLPSLQYDAVVTDPVWPNAPSGMFNISCTPFDLMKTTADLFDCKRILIVMRWDSDPRFLSSIPDKYNFIRVLNLPYGLPSHVGRTLGGMEYAYVFGDYPEAKEHKRILPGIAPYAPYTNRASEIHPCPRPQRHVDWLVDNWVHKTETFLDPFMGSGTAGIAATKTGRKFIGIEKEQQYFDDACRKIEMATKQLSLFGGL